MERICRLLNDALTPYEARLGQADTPDRLQLSVHDRHGALVLQRSVTAGQLQDQRLLVDLVDGLHRDLQIAEGRLIPCVIAASRNLQPAQGTFA